jgi:hypothetical protein
MNILFSDYTFIPSERKIVFNSWPVQSGDISIAKILLITNITVKEQLYSFNDPSYSGSFSGGVLTLDYNTSEMLSSDVLQIYLYADNIATISIDGGLGSVGTPLSVNVINSIPPSGTPNRRRYLSLALSANGGVQYGSTGTNMNVNGSSSPAIFYCGALPDRDIHITSITILISDLNVAHNLFGKLSPLGIGFSIVAEDSGDTSYIIHKAKTIGNLIAQSGGYYGFGNDIKAWEITNWAPNQDATIITIPVGSLVPEGIRLGRGTQDKIKAIVSDDLTGLDNLIVSIIGYTNNVI